MVARRIMGSRSKDNNNTCTPIHATVRGVLTKFSLTAAATEARRIGSGVISGAGLSGTFGT